MISPDFVRLMAAYASWQNDSLLTAGTTLTTEDRTLDRGAFFGSIQATLSHLLWADRLWLSRFTAAVAPPDVPDISGSTAAFEAWGPLCEARRELDAELRAWAERVTASDLEGPLSWYSGAMQADITRPRWALVLQLFNHGTHHRGQVHAMLTAAGAKPDDTDVPFMPSTHWDWSR